MSLGSINPFFFPSSTDETPSSADFFPLVSPAGAAPILRSASDPPALTRAVRDFSDDIFRVTARRPHGYEDKFRGWGPTKEEWPNVIIVGTLESDVIKRVREGIRSKGQNDLFDHLEGKWEAFDMRVVHEPLEGITRGLVICGSNMRGAIYALYTLSEHLGVSPWYWWADVPIPHRPHAYFDPAIGCFHGEPTVKYRGFFINDEKPVFWDWAREHFQKGLDEPPLREEVYERLFELLLRLKGNYLWPAMWDAMFSVDPLPSLPSPPRPGPNQLLASKWGVIMGTSHHEPMARNQKEWNTFGEGEWNFQRNKEELEAFWKYGAERAHAGKCETVFTVGMRGNGDLPIDAGDVPLIEQITASQQKVLHDVYGEQMRKGEVPQMWAMYKEVLESYANGMHVPEDVTILFGDDNWGNLQAVLDPKKPHIAGGGIYYHADYVGDPRSYRWINTVSLAKMWQQLHTALSFKTSDMWILNVGDLKFLELPLEYFMSLSYDFPRWNRDSLLEFLSLWAIRDFGVDRQHAQQAAEVIARWTQLASRRKAELVEVDTYSPIHFDELENIVAEWTTLERDAQAIHETLNPKAKVAFYEVVLIQIKLYRNLHEMHLAAARSLIAADLSLTSANAHANRTIELFNRDAELTDDFHSLLDGKWNHMLSQPHIGYKYWQAPLRDQLPSIGMVQTRHTSRGNHNSDLSIRYIVEGSLGGWPADSRHNCALGYNCPDPTLAPMDPWGKHRWVKACLAGTRDASFTVEVDADWLRVEPKGGKLLLSGEQEIKVVLSVDWKAARDSVKSKSVAEARATFKSSDASQVVVTVPIHLSNPPPDNFKGPIQGDGYVAIEAANFGRNMPGTGTDGQTYTIEDVPFFGRTKSGISIFPVSDTSFGEDQRPAVEYDFWVHTPSTFAESIESCETCTSPAGQGKDARQSTDDRTVEIALHLSPALNFIPRKPLELAVSLDPSSDSPAEYIQPVPPSKPGALPEDWEQVVADEIRIVRRVMQLKGEVVGRHTVRVEGVTCGWVLERVVVDLGGVKGKREGTKLGPPESCIV